MPTLCSLNGTCKSLGALCRPLCFRTITISTIGSLKSHTFEKLAIILSESPEIVDYIQNLNILDRDVFSGLGGMSVEEETLCYILTRRYPNLKYLELSLHAAWFLLPPQVQHAFELAFSLPSLQAISLKHFRIPLDLLSYLQSLQSLEIQCEVSPPCYNEAYPNTHCTPKILKYYDPSQFGHGSKNIFLARSALLLSSLEYLEVYAPARYVGLLQARFQHCYRTLTILKIYPLHESFNEVWNESSHLDLKSLSHLKSLVLYTDISEAMYTATLQGPARNAFWWMLDTLRTCHQPSLIDNVEIVIQVKDLADTSKCPWEEVERVFYPRVGWKRLKELHIRHNGNQGNKWYEKGYTDGVILPKMPVLTSMISVRFTISDFFAIHRQEADMYM